MLQLSPFSMCVDTKYSAHSHHLRLSAKWLNRMVVPLARKLCCSFANVSFVAWYTFICRIFCNKLFSASKLALSWLRASIKMLYIAWKKPNSTVLLTSIDDMFFRTLDIVKAFLFFRKPWTNIAKSGDRIYKAAYVHLISQPLQCILTTPP